MYQDALQFEFPAGPIVVCLFSPLEREAMERFLPSPESDLERRPREAVVVCYVSDQASLLDRSPMFERTFTEVDYVIFRHDPLRRSSGSQAAADATDASAGRIESAAKQE